jgi:hypothetical protein
MEPTVDPLYGDCAIVYNTFKKYGRLSVAEILAMEPEEPAPSRFRRLAEQVRRRFRW